MDRIDTLLIGIVGTLVFCIVLLSTFELNKRTEELEQCEQKILIKYYDVKNSCN